MQGGLGLAFLEGDRQAIDAAWAALGRALPRLEVLPEADFVVVGFEGRQDVLRDLDAIGWLGPAPDLAPGTPDELGTPIDWPQE